MDLQGSLRVQRRRRPLSPKAMYWESNKNRAIYSDYRQEKTMKASQKWCSWKLRFLRMKRKSEEVRSKEDHFGRSSSPSGKGVRYEYDFGNEECGHLCDGVSDSPVTVPSDRSLSCFSKLPITARSPHCDLRGHELLVSSTVAVCTFLPDSSSCVCQCCHRFYLFFMPESAIYNRVFLLLLNILDQLKSPIARTSGLKSGKSNCFLSWAVKTPALTHIAFAGEWVCVPTDPAL